MGDSLLVLLGLGVADVLAVVVDVCDELALWDSDVVSLWEGLLLAVRDTVGVREMFTERVAVGDVSVDRVMEGDTVSEGESVALVLPLCVNVCVCDLLIVELGVRECVSSSVPLWLSLWLTADDRVHEVVSVPSSLAVTVKLSVRVVEVDSDGDADADIVNVSD